MDGVCGFDALIVGAGFGGINMLCRLRNFGFSAKIYEAASYLGGTWFWNRYPGARVDSSVPVYQYFGSEDSPTNFEWSERFPCREELQRYFHYLDKTLNLSKDISYNTYVTEAEFDDLNNFWRVKTATDTSTTARHLILCTGFATRRYTPQFKGLGAFKGIWCHSARWPEADIDVKGKRVAVVGTGSTGVQIIQELGTQVDHLTVYQRTPNLALPMRQKFAKNSDSEAESDRWKWPANKDYPILFGKACQTFGGMVEDFTSEKFEETSPSDRQLFYEKLWAYGGFAFWLASYFESFYIQEVNDEAYQFWVNKVRHRVHDSSKKDLLAPLIAPHAWGTKRPCLESTYYEVLNQDNVDIIDVSAFPILEIVPEGVETENGIVPVDILIFATGFDSVTGGILDIIIRNSANGMTIQDKWEKGTKTALGLCAHDFPNMYWLYGPHAPTAFSNGPTCVWIQSNWIAELMLKMRKMQETRVEAEESAELDWTNKVKALWDATLFPGTASPYQGTNIPGKIQEPLNYIGGISKYSAELQECQNNNYRGFIFC